jgi:hypothetical protein
VVYILGLVSTDMVRPSGRGFLVLHHFSPPPISYPDPKPPPPPPPPQLPYPGPTATPNPYEHPLYTTPSPDPFSTPLDPYRPQLQGPPHMDYIGGELPYPSSRISQAYELQDDPFETGPGQSTHDILLLQRENCGRRVAALARARHIRAFYPRGSRGDHEYALRAHPAACAAAVQHDEDGRVSAAHRGHCHC